jgi:hypothetical protein
MYIWYNEAFFIVAPWCQIPKYGPGSGRGVNILNSFLRTADEDLSVFMFIARFWHGRVGVTIRTPFEVNGLILQRSAVLFVFYLHRAAANFYVLFFYFNPPPLSTCLLLL